LELRRQTISKSSDDDIHTRRPPIPPYLFNDDPLLYFFSRSGRVLTHDMTLFTNACSKSNYFPSLEPADAMQQTAGRGRGVRVDTLHTQPAAILRLQIPPPTPQTLSSSQLANPLFRLSVSLILLPSRNHMALDEKSMVMPHAILGTAAGGAVAALIMFTCSLLPRNYARAIIHPEKMLFEVNYKINKGANSWLCTLGTRTQPVGTRT